VPNKGKGQQISSVKGVEVIMVAREMTMTSVRMKRDAMIKAISIIGNRPRMDTSTYSGSLNPKDLIDWIIEFEGILDLRRVKFACQNFFLQISL
jgi:hypothetical protein